MKNVIGLMFCLLLSIGLESEHVNFQKHEKGLQNWYKISITDLNIDPNLKVEYSVRRLEGDPFKYYIDSLFRIKAINKNDTIEVTFHDISSFIEGIDKENDDIDTCELKFDFIFKGILTLEGIVENDSFNSVILESDCRPGLSHGITLPTKK